MKFILRFTLCFFILGGVGITKPDFLVGQQSQQSNNIWVSAYMASWNHYAPPGGNWGTMPTEAIDWDAFTHLFYFSFTVNRDGTLAKIEPYENINPDRLNSIVKAAHDAGKPVLFTIGGWGNHDDFAKAISPGTRSVLVNNVIQILKTWKFDGIDLDLEPIKDSDLENYGKFITELHRKLQSLKTPMLDTPLLTVATNGQPEFFARVHPKLDQINLMTYDLSGAWSGWVSWHNAAVYSNKYFPGNGKPLPSVDQMVQAYTKAGVPASKLGIGIDFYGYVWKGGYGTSTGGTTVPGQSWTIAPTVTDNVPYHKIMDKYYPSAKYQWDDEAKAAFLSIDQPGSEYDKFISFDDERSVKAKFDYVSKHQLGGVIIWELTGGYRPNQPAGQRNLLLQAVQNALQDHQVVVSTSGQQTQDKK